QASGYRLAVSTDGSGALLGRLKIDPGSADVFIAAEQGFMNEAVRLGLVEKSVPFATMRPLVAVRPGNPKNIAALPDLLRDDVRVSLADPDAAAIGVVARRLLTAAGIWDRLEARLRPGGLSYQGT